MAMALRALQTTMERLQQWRSDTGLAPHRTLGRIGFAAHGLWAKQRPCAAMHSKTQAAWQALARKGVLPPLLAEQTGQIAQRELGVPDTARSALAL